LNFFFCSGSFPTLTSCDLQHVFLLYDTHFQVVSTFFLTCSNESPVECFDQLSMDGPPDREQEKHV